MTAGLSRICQIVGDIAILDGSLYTRIVVKKEAVNENGQEGRCFPVGK